MPKRKSKKEEEKTLPVPSHPKRMKFKDMNAKEFVKVPFKARLFERVYENLEELCDEINNYFNQDDLVPTVEGLSNYLGVAKSTINHWLDDESNPRRADLIRQSKTYIVNWIITQGVNGKMHPALAIFLPKILDPEYRQDNNKEGTTINIRDNSGDIIRQIKEDKKGARVIDFGKDEEKDKVKVIDVEEQKSD